MPLLVTKMGNCVMVLARWRIAVSLPVTTLTEKESANTFEREKERIQINSGNRWMEGGASRDGFSFYGSGKMVACFRYVSIDVHSVFLPPFKFDFSHEIQDWIKKDADEKCCLLKCSMPLLKLWRKSLVEGPLKVLYQGLILQNWKRFYKMRRLNLRKHCERL